MNLRLEFESPLESQETSLEEFIASNEALDAEDLSVLTGLRIGESYAIGGGAAAEFTVRRVA